MKRIIFSEKAPAPAGPYSQAVEAGGILFISGQVPIDRASGQIAGGGIEGQTRQVMENIGAILEAAGYTFRDVVSTTCLLADMADFTVMNEVYVRYFPVDPPARVTFAVKGLPLGALVEIETRAVK